MIGKNYLSVIFSVLICVNYVVCSKTTLEDLEALVEASQPMCGKKLVNVVKAVCHPAVVDLVNEKSDKPDRFKRGLIDDCCKNKCSLQTLVIYCPIKHRPKE